MFKRLRLALGPAVIPEDPSLIEPEIPIEVHDLMRHILTQRGIEKWWIFPNGHLDGRTPQEAWADGDVDAVRELIAGYLSPSFS